MSRANTVLFTWLRSRWLRRRLRLTELSSVVDKLRNLLTENMIQTKLCRNFGHSGEKIRTKVWSWSWVTAWLSLLNIRRYNTLLIIFGRFTSISIRKLPWRSVPNFFRFLCNQGIFISALFYLFQFKDCWRYICLYGFSSRDNQCPMVATST
jgi:hypothetical protein